MSYIKTITQFDLANQLLRECAKELQDLNVIDSPTRERLLRGLSATNKAINNYLSIKPIDRWKQLDNTY